MKYLKYLNQFDDFHDYAISDDFSEPNITLLSEDYDEENLFYNDLVTDITNPELMEIARNAGWVEPTASAMTYGRAFKITTEEFNDANRIKVDSSVVNGYDNSFKNLIHFDEFKWFLSVTATTFTMVEDGVYKGGFLNCRNLESIKLPKNLKILGNNCFLYCNRLKTIEFPDGLKQVSRNCFAYTYIDTVKFNKGLNVIGIGAFWMAPIDSRSPIPNTITRLDDNAINIWYNTFQETLDLPRLRFLGIENFIWCFGPRYLNLGEVFETIGGGPDYTGEYNDCFWPTLEKITLDENNPNFKCVDNIYMYSKDGKYFYGGANYGASKQKVIRIEEGCEKILAGSFRSLFEPMDAESKKYAPSWFTNEEMITETMVLPSTLTYIGNRVCQYSKFKDLVINAVTPPTYEYTHSFISITGNIYVPDESVDAYKTANGWKTKINRIKPMSSFTGAI